MSFADTIDRANPTPLLNRRKTVLGAFGLAATALTLPLSRSSAFAGRGWCRADPVVMIDGQLADIFLSSQLVALLSTTGPVKLIVTTPPDVEAYLVLADLGFGYGYDLSFETSADLVKTDDHTPVLIDVYVPAIQSSLPITVNFAPRLLDILWPVQVDGTANSWIRLASGV